MHGTIPLMQYILSLLFASLLVAAQSSWKVAVNSDGNPFNRTLSLISVIKFMFTPLVLMGIALYLMATLLYFYLLSKYRFSMVQSIAIPMSLIFSLMVATAFFGEQLSLINFIGLILVVAGIVLLTLR